jgi:Ca2+-binding RTX toxin-like protein
LLENDFVALSTLRSEWTSASSFNDRVGHLLGTLAGGVNGGLTLTPATVKEDFAQDTLIGSSGRDWYFRNSLGATAAFRDTVTDADVDSVFEEIHTWL